MDQVKLIKGFNPRIALPVLLVSIFVVGLFLWILGQIPSKSNWVILRDFNEWRPHIVPDSTD